MNIIKLEKEHAGGISHLFYNYKYMGVPINKTTWNKPNPESLNVYLYDVFCETYLSGLNNFHAFGLLDDDGRINGLMSFYEDINEPSWYLTLSRSSGDRKIVKDLLDHTIAYNEANGRLKFYTLMNTKHAKVMRRFSWSEYNTERYGYFDELFIPAKTRCIYYNPWEIFFQRTLVPTDTIVRCSFLKQEYRTKIPLGGGI